VTVEEYRGFLATEVRIACQDSSALLEATRESALGLLKEAVAAGTEECWLSGGFPRIDQGAARCFALLGTAVAERLDLDRPGTADRDLSPPDGRFVRVFTAPDTVAASLSPSECATAFVLQKWEFQAEPDGS
jgi:hypothetical protein